MSRAGGNGLGLPIGGILPIAYTPTVTWAGNTITTQSGFYLKTPGLLQVWVSFIETAGTATATLTITIPTGYTAVTHTGSISAQVGQIARISGTGSNYPMWIVAGGTTSITSATGTTQGVVDTWGGYFAIPTLT